MEARESTKKLGWIIFLLFSACILFGRLVYWYLASPQNFPLTKVKIVATFQNLTREQLSDFVNPYLQYSYFSLPISQLRKELKQIDWVKNVSVERIWPNRLCIKIIEKNPKLLWNNQLMTNNGLIIRAEPKHIDGLPRLVGPPEQKEDVLQKYEKLSKILTNANLTLTMLRLHPNQSWTAEISDGILVELGKRDIEERVTRFCRAYRATLADKMDQLAIVDLRYARGMAVKWKGNKK